MRNIKAIIFDCDGTLLDSERIYLSTWEIVAKPMGYEVPMDVLMDNRGKSKAYARENLLRAMGEDFPIDEINEKRYELNETLFLQSDNVVKPGVLNLLDWMKAQGLLAAVASAKPCKMTADHLQHAGLLERFHAVVGGDMVARNKPEPDSFLKAAELLNVASDECLVIGDTPSDVKAAKAAGMTVVFVPDLIEADEEVKRLADIRLNQIDEIIDILKGE